MNGRIRFVLVAAALALAAPASVSAQSLYISGGAGFPTGDFGDLTDTGWQIAGGIMFADIGTPGLSLGVDGSYGQNSIKDFSIIGVDVEGNIKTYGIMGIALYSFANESGIEPYLFGGAGWLGADGYVSATDGSTTESDSDSESAFGYQLGAGIGYGLSENISIYGEGRYTGGTGDLSDIKWISVLAGLSFAI
jgi:opacity protein-like surface antigen